MKIFLENWHFSSSSKCDISGGKIIQGQCSFWHHMPKHQVVNHESISHCLSGLLRLHLEYFMHFSAYWYLIGKGSEGKGANWMEIREEQLTWLDCLRNSFKKKGHKHLNIHGLTNNMHSLAANSNMINRNTYLYNI